MADKIVIYQVLPRLFGNTESNCIPDSSIDINGCGKLNDFDIDTLDLIKELGCTHIWFTGIIRQATQSSFPSIGLSANNPSIVKGKAGSPYSITDYYDISPELSVDINNRIGEFQDLVDRCHTTGLKVLIDFVPNHVSREYNSINNPEETYSFGKKDKSDYGFHPMNNFYYILGSSFTSPVKSDGAEFTEMPAKVTGNDCTIANPSLNDWYETAKLNYGNDIFTGNSYYDPIPDTWIKMRDILLFWADKKIDGFRCDMVGMVPEEFWNWVIPLIKERHPNILFIGEIYDKTRYERFLNYCKFDYLYDKVGLYDTFKEIFSSRLTLSAITDNWQSLGEYENSVLNFIENHDEVRVASDYYLKDANRAIPALATGILLNKAPYLIYFGQEMGERGMDAEGYSHVDGKTSIFDYWSVPAVRKFLLTGESSELRNKYKQIISIATRERAVSSGDRFDLKYANHDSECTNIFPFVRKIENELLLILSNFSTEKCYPEVNFPSEMFEYLNIETDREYRCTELLSNKKSLMFLSDKKSLKIELSGSEVRIFKLLL